MLSKIRITIASILVVAVITAYFIVDQTYLNQVYEMIALGMATVLFAERYLIKLVKHLIKVF